MKCFSQVELNAWLNAEQVRIAQAKQVLSDFNLRLADVFRQQKELEAAVAEKNPPPDVGSVRCDRCCAWIAGECGITVCVVYEGLLRGVCVCPPCLPAVRTNGFGFYSFHSIEGQYREAIARWNAAQQELPLTTPGHSEKPDQA